DRRDDAGFRQRHLAFEELELEPDRTQFLAGEEIGIVEGEPVGRRACLRGVGNALPGLDVAFRVGEPPLRIAQIRHVASLPPAKIASAGLGTYRLRPLAASRKGMT